MEKTRKKDFKKMRDTKGIFHAKMGSIKDRNGMDLTEQKILRRGGKNTQKNYTKESFGTAFHCPQACTDIRLYVHLCLVYL